MTLEAATETPSEELRAEAKKGPKVEAKAEAESEKPSLASSGKSVQKTLTTGGKSAASRGATWKRLAGSNALGTMKQIVKVGFSKSDTVLLASSEGWWDALAASSLAGAHKAPVLLSASSTLSSDTESEIKRLGAKKVYVCGGTAALSSAIDSRLKALGVSVQRLAGRTAVETSVAIAREVGAKAGDTCIIATVGGYWDALSASPLAYAKVAPIFLTRQGDDGLSSAVLDSVRQLGFSQAVVTGGTAAVPAAVESQLKGLGVDSVRRLGGANAYDTSALVANYARDPGMSVNSMGVATGKGYWDALTGSALCGLNNSVLVLADDNNRSTVDKVYYKRLSQAKKGYVFGGQAAVSKLTWDYLHHRASDGKVVPTAGVLAHGKIYAIFVQGGNSLLVEVPGASTKAGAQLQMSAVTGLQEQKFIARDLGGGYYGLQSLASRLYLASSGGKLVQVAKSKAASQQWAIMPATAGISLVNKGTGQAAAYTRASKAAAVNTVAPSGAASQRFDLRETDAILPGYYVIYNSRGKALTVSGDNPYAAGANIDIHTADDSGEQVFYISKVGEYYHFVNAKSYKGVAAMGSSNGSNVTQQRDSNAAAQLWKASVDDAGYLLFANRASDKYLDVAGNGNANGTYVQVYGGSGNSGQQWRLAPTEAYSLSGNDELDQWLASIVEQNGNDLYSCYTWALGSTAAVNEVDGRRPWGIQGDDVSIDYALIGKRRGVSDCYVNGAMFNWLARACGYSANFRAGAVPSASSGQAAHGWTEVYRNGVTYVCDVSLGRSYTNLNWYMITYANAPIAYYL